MLKRSRWLLLKRPEKLTGEQRGRLAELVRRNLRTVRAYLLKEDFQSLWGYVSPYWAGQFLDRWCTRTMRSRLDPMKEVARMVALAPRPVSELVPSPGAVLQWRCRRLQRKGQSDHQTGVWVPHLRGTGSRFVSRTWRPARTKTHPQILLTRPEANGETAIGQVDESRRETLSELVGAFRQRPAEQRSEIEEYLKGKGFTTTRTGRGSARWLTWEIKEGARALKSGWNWSIGFYLRGVTLTLQSSPWIKGTAKENVIRFMKENPIERCCRRARRAGISWRTRTRNTVIAPHTGTISSTAGTSQPCRFGSRQGGSGRSWTSSSLRVPTTTG